MDTRMGADVDIKSLTRHTPTGLAGMTTTTNIRIALDGSHDVTFDTSRTVVSSCEGVRASITDAGQSLAYMSVA